MNDVTAILEKIEKGEASASEELIPLVYSELRAMASAQLAHEKPGQTLQATGLVHEAYMRLVHGQAQQWNSRGHFFTAAAEAMRRILIDRARRKNSLKAGGNFKRIELPDVASTDHDDPMDLIALDEALRKLESKDARKAQLVKLRFFAGLTNKQAAEALNIASSTADADWAYAKCWLRAEMLDSS